MASGFVTVYRSLPARFPSIDVIGSITQAAERRNASLGVSSVLVYSRQANYHLLEGSERSLSLIYEHVRHDPRHEIQWKRSGRISGSPLLPDLPLGLLDADNECAHAWRGIDTVSAQAGTLDDITALIALILRLTLAKYSASAAAQIVRRLRLNPADTSVEEAVSG